MCGVRVNVIHAAQTSTQGTPYEDIIDVRRKESKSAYQSAAQYTGDNNQTALVDPFTGKVYENKEGSGFYGTGFVEFIRGSTPQSVALEQIKSFADAGMFSQRLKAAAVEVMFYNLYLKFGLIHTFTFDNSNSGLLSHRIDESVFLFNQYAFPSGQAQTRVACFILFSLIFALQLAGLVWKTIRYIQVWLHRKENRFQTSDYLLFMQLIVTACVITQFISLFATESYQLSLPMENENQFQKWKLWAEEFETYRAFLATELVIASLVWLNLTKQWIPSFGIVSETLGHSAKYLIIFTFIVTLVLFSTSVGCFCVFGHQIEEYERFSTAIDTNFQLIVGTFDYERIYKANPSIAVYFYVIFIFFFCYFVLNMYKAILVQTYNEIHQRKLLLTEAIALQMMEQGTSFSQKLRNFLCCRVPEYSTGALQNEDASSLLTRARYNFSQFSNVYRAETKHEFVTNLQAKCQRIQEQREVELQKKVDYYQQITNERGKEEGFEMLAHFCLYLVYLVFLVLLSIELTAGDNSISINQHIRDVFVENALTTDTVKPFRSDEEVFRLMDYEMLTTYSGSAHWGKIMDHFSNNEDFASIIDPDEVFRVSIRLYQAKENSDIATKEVFPIFVPPMLYPQRDYLSVPGSPSWLDLTTIQMLGFAGQTGFGSTNEFTESFSFDCGEERDCDGSKTFESKESSEDHLTESANGQGGYVFSFRKAEDGQFRNLVTGLTLQELLSQPWNRQHAVAQVSLDFVLFTHNFDMYAYVLAVFDFEAAGNMVCRLHIQSVQLDLKKNVDFIILFILFLVFNIVYSWFFLKSIYYKYCKLAGPSSQQIQQQSRCRKCLNLLGIEQHRLQGRECLVTFIKTIYKIIMTWVKRFRLLTKAVQLYCQEQVFNCTELLNLVLRWWFTVLVINQLSVKSFEIDSEGHSTQAIAKLSNILWKVTSVEYVLGPLVFFSIVHIYRYLKFSLNAYLPFIIIQRAQNDLLNLLILIMLSICVQTLCSFVLFAPSDPAFSTFSRSFMNQIQQFVGTYNINFLKEHREHTFLSFFFTLVVICNFILLVIFLAIIIGHTIDEYKECSTLLQDRDFFHDVYLILKAKYRDEKKKGNITRSKKYLDWIFDPKDKVSVKTTIFDDIRQSPQPELNEKAQENQLLSNFESQSQQYTLYQQKQSLNNLVDDFGMRPQALREYINLQGQTNTFSQNMLQDPLNMRQFLSEQNQTHLEVYSTFWQYHIQESLDQITRSQLQLSDFNSEQPCYQSTYEWIGKQELVDADIARTFARTTNIDDKIRIWRAIDSRTSESDLVTRSVSDLQGSRSDTPSSDWMDELANLQFKGDSQQSQSKSWLTSDWFTAQNQECSSLLISLWNNNMSKSEQYKLFFTKMTSRERARLWSGLVFPQTLIKECVQKVHRKDLSFMWDQVEKVCRVAERSKKKIRKNQKVGERDIYTAQVLRCMWKQLRRKMQKYSIKNASFFQLLVQIVGEEACETFELAQGGEALHQMIEMYCENSGISLINESRLQSQTLNPDSSQTYQYDQRDGELEKSILTFIRYLTDVNSDVQKVIKSASFTQEQKYIQICQLIECQTGQKAERLSLFFTMTLEEKTDLLLHLLLEEERHMLHLMIEKTFTNNAEHQFNVQLEQALNQQTFIKISNLTRLAAAQKSMEKSIERISELDKKDQEQLDYAVYLKQRYEEMEHTFHDLQKRERDKVKENNAEKQKLLEIAYRYKTIKNELQSRASRSKQTNQIQLEITNLLSQEFVNINQKQIQKALKYAEYAQQAENNQICQKVDDGNMNSLNSFESSSQSSGDDHYIQITNFINQKHTDQKSLQSLASFGITEEDDHNLGEYRPANVANFLRQ